MARDRNTYAKRQRENEKKQKAEEKRARRQKKKELAADTGSTYNVDRLAPGQEPDGRAGP